MMQAVAARAAASAAAAAALVASATALASRASTSVRGARLACGRWRRAAHREEVGLLHGCLRVGRTGA